MAPTPPLAIRSRLSPPLLNLPMRIPENARGGLQSRKMQSLDFSEFHDPSLHRAEDGALACARQAHGNGALGFHGFN